jgi:hypothetical protein
MWTGRRTDEHGENNVGSCPLILLQRNACTDRRDSAVGIATGYGLDDQGVGV